MQLYDAHSHLYSRKEFKLAENLIVCGASVRIDDMPLLVDFKNKNRGKVLSAFGFHPRYLDGFECDVLARYLEGADAVGEIGFDKFSTFNLDRQKSCFEAQLDMAIQRNLPIVIHQVGLWNELEASLKKLRPKKFLIHAAKCSVELVKKFEALGGWFSFGKRELETRAGALALVSASTNRILLESDMYSDFEGLKSTYLCASGILNLKDVELFKKIEENFCEYFNNG